MSELLSKAEFIIKNKDCNFDDYVFYLRKTAEAQQEELTAIKKAHAELIDIGGKEADEIEWQPIETVPKDGSLIMVYYLDEIIIDRWVERENDWEQNWMEPTHWMPLPQIPEDAKDE